MRIRCSTAWFVRSPEPPISERVLEALRLGKPVLCEKPIGFNLAGADNGVGATSHDHGKVRQGRTRLGPAGVGIGAADEVHRGMVRGHLRTEFPDLARADDRNPQVVAFVRVHTCA